MITISAIGLFFLITLIGVVCILVGVSAGMTAQERYAGRERRLGEQLLVLIHLPKLRLVEDLAAAQAEVVSAHRAVGELTGLNKTLESELRTALESATEDRHTALWTAALALAESWAKLLPHAGSLEEARRELRALLDSTRPTPTGQGAV